MGLDPKQIKKKPIFVGEVSSDPSPVTGAVVIYSKKVSGVAEMFVMDDSGNSTQVTQTGSLSLPTLPSLVPLGGAENTILTKDSSTDYDTVWKKSYQIQKEFYFTLPAAADITARILAAGSITGLNLYAGDTDPSPSDNFGTSAKTLVMEPTSGSDLILMDWNVLEKQTTGTLSDQGYKKLDPMSEVKTNTNKTKAAFINLQDDIDISRDVVVYLRFITELEMQSI